MPRSLFQLGWPCPNCAYDLRGRVNCEPQRMEFVCPECGEVANKAEMARLRSTIPGIANVWYAAAALPMIVANILFVAAVVAPGQPVVETGLVILFLGAPLRLYALGVWASARVYGPIARFAIAVPLGLLLVIINVFGGLLFFLLVAAVLALFGYAA